ncbi:DUF819 family protein [bacterium]|nr:DUF819 family protein [bacterium]
MTIGLFSVFLLLFPAFALYSCHKSAIIDKIGAGMLCFAVGILLGNLGILPEGIKGTRELFMHITVPLSIPLMIFSTDFKRWTKLAGKSLLSFCLIALSVMLVSFLAFFLFKSRIDEAWKIAGMFIGGYTGATPNFFAVAMALKVDEQMLVLANAAAWLVEVPWFIFILAASQRVIGKFLLPFCSADTVTSIDSLDAINTCEKDKASISDYSEMLKPEKLVPLIKALVLAMIIFGIGFGAYSVTPESYNMAVLMLTITTLGIFSSFIPAVRNIDKSFQLGQYIILIFCVAIGTTADFNMLLSSSPTIILFAAVVLYGAWLLHILLSRLFGIDTDTQIITSVAAIFSPVFVPLVASSLKNREVIVSGLAAGILGYASGNYLGITFAHLLKAFY